MKTLKQLTREELFLCFEDYVYKPVINKKTGKPSKNRDGSIKEYATSEREIPAETKRKLEELLARDDVLGMVVFRCNMLDSSQLGRCTAVIFGPGCENKTLEELAAKRLGDVPSRFMDAESYYLKG